MYYNKRKKTAFPDVLVEKGICVNEFLSKIKCKNISLEEYIIMTIHLFIVRFL